MFNRTNLTLSARSLSNRLNLGTRSFALDANVKNGGRTLRTRHAHLDVLREAMAWHDEYPMVPVPVGCVIPSIIGSFSRQQGGSGGQPRQPGHPAADVRVATRTRPADLVGVGVVGPCVEVGILGRRPASGAVASSSSSAERSSRSSERSSLDRRERECAGRLSPAKPGLKRAARRAAASAAAPAAIFAAAGPGK